MPVFEYQCEACRHEFEELVRSAGAADRAACPACGSRKVARKLSVFAARQAESRAARPGGACGRCGDPNGPCGT
ncbi:MAG: zinc ribbon domain-containing protein [Phycisphaerae bacterium]